MDGQSIRRVLEWLLSRDLTDADLAAALDIPPATFSRHKDRQDFPTFEDLQQLGTAFGINPLMLQISFGYLGLEALSLLDDEGMWQFLRQGGGNYIHPPLVTSKGKSPPRYRRQENVDAL
jgi:transcriptional regulator with XRE-family HTH domain